MKATEQPCASFWGSCTCFFFPRLLLSPNFLPRTRLQNQVYIKKTCGTNQAVLEWQHGLIEISFFMTSLLSLYLSPLPRSHNFCCFHFCFSFHTRLYFTIYPSCISCTVQLRMTRRPASILKVSPVTDKVWKVSMGNISRTVSVNRLIYIVVVFHSKNVNMCWNSPESTLKRFKIKTQHCFKKMVLISSLPEPPTSH